ncbi:MAG TPA: ABC transporter permease [Clostridiaceae bacterium]|jgi:ribose transport system permease protein|nr:ABC transporter permease [Clostridiaceae bacterium]
MMKNSIKNFKRSQSFYSFIGLALVFVIASLIVKEFLTFNNIITVLRQGSVLLILSTGLTAVILTGNMDLSVGAASGLVGCLCAQLLKSGVPIPVVFVIGLITGAIIGIFNGFLVGIVKLPSFIATYGTNWVVAGLSIIIMNGDIIYGLPEGFTWLGTGYVGPIPFIIIVALIMVIVAYVMLQKTTFGRDIYAYGSNKDAALYSAVPIKKTLFSAFIMSGVTAAIAGILMTARLDAADSTMGDAYGLQTVAAVVVGGTSMLGGEGGITGTVIGAILLTIIVNVMNLLGITSFAQPMVVGIVILVMVLFDSYSRRRQNTTVKKDSKKSN